MYYVKSSRVGQPKPFETIEEVIEEVRRILESREAGMQYGKIIIERR